MNEIERRYPYSKDMMLNVIYDTLDRLNLIVISVNSERGRIQFQDDNQNGYILKIDTIYPEENTKLTVEPKDQFSDFIYVFFDELNSTITSTKQ